MGVGAGLYMYDVVKKFTFAISSPGEFLVLYSMNCRPNDKLCYSRHLQTSRLGLVLVSGG